MDNVRCTGQEREISECRFDSWGESDCDPSEAAGVICDLSEDKKPNTVTKVDQRLTASKKIQKSKIKVSNYNFYNNQCCRMTRTCRVSWVGKRD